VSFSGKVQKKPLEMLTCIVSLGGKNISREQLTDLLWPDSDGDQAQSAFHTTVSRLRHILGTDDAIEIKGGRVSLNPRYCWLDMWVFERLVQRMDAKWSEMSDSGEVDAGEIAKGMALGEKAAGAYGGPFLPGEDMPSVLTARKKLRKMFNHLVVSCGKRLEATGEWEKAAVLYERAIDTDETVDEEIYRGLMTILKHRGDSGRAIELYRQCRKILAMTLGAKPSKKTEAVYRELH
jgi:DNA-binding SARP family transcriptional activator